MTDINLVRPELIKKESKTVVLDGQKFRITLVTGDSIQPHYQFEMRALKRLSQRKHEGNDLFWRKVSSNNVYRLNELWMKANELFFPRE